MSKQLTSKIVVVLSCVLLISAFSPIQIVVARDSDDVGEEIEAEKRRLAQIEKQLASAQAELDRTRKSLSGVQGELPRLEAEMAEIEATLAYNAAQVEFLSQNQLLAQLSHEEKAQTRDQLLLDSYATWRAEAGLIGTFRSNKKTHPLKRDVYRSQLIESESVDIKSLAEELNQINNKLANYKAENADLEQQNTELQKRKSALEAQLLALRRNANSQAGTVAGLRNNAGSAKQVISMLSEEQRRLKQYEDSIIENPGDGGKKPLEPGDYYFSGTGRDNYQGHGVGMSQWGAHGGASKGMSASQILEFYYKSAKVTNYANMTTQITVKYCKGKPSAVAYQEGCNYGGTNYGPVVEERVDFNEYLSGLYEMPRSWPVEARKAQIIAARTYALRYTSNGNPSKPICLTTYCQVTRFKDGDRGEMSLVQDTGSKVITHNGALIEALYSADNSQGYGTANNDTIFSNMSGDGTPYAYLRAVDDSAFATKTSWTKWAWRTDGFQISEIKDLLTFTKNDTKQSSSQRNFAAGILTDIGGSVTRLDFERDPSNRVKKVIITGPKGSRAMASWMFKGIWNVWVGTVRPHGSVDYIYSRTFALLKK